MKILHPTKLLASSDGFDAYFQSVAEAPARVLLLDFDGTLAPFTVDRHATRPYPGIAERLERLTILRNHRLVIISGRAIADLVKLLPIEPRPEFWGSHGWERLTPGQTIPELHPLSPAMADGLSEARLWSSTQGLDDWIEIKPTSIALHWRGREPDRVDEVRVLAEREWSRLAELGGLEVHAFDGGLELRATGRDKGTVVRTILPECEPAAAVAYLGDDLTDEDAFHALGDRGLRVLVRPTLRPTQADLWIVPPEELLQFLDRWIQAS